MNTCTYNIRFHGEIRKIFCGYTVFYLELCVRMDETEALLMCFHNIYFCGEIRKKYCVGTPSYLELGISTWKRA